MVSGLRLYSALTCTMQLWRYQGLKTLGDYLRKRDCVKELAMDLQVPEHLAVPTVLKHLLDSIQVRRTCSLVASHHAGCLTCLAR